MILLNRSYYGFPAGSVVEFPAELEIALVTQGLASQSAGPVTPGPQSRTDSANPMIPVLVGTASVPVAGTSVTISNANITANSKVFAVISQAVADGTATSVVRAVATVGVATVYVNAAATAATEVSYLVFA